MNKYVQMADRLYAQNQQIERLEKENAELKEVHESDKRSLRLIVEKSAKLEKEISILLSCKNCPDNKGGYICHKEYEDKCLAQKIQYIKELEKENTELQQKWLDESYEKTKLVGQLNKAKEIIKEMYECLDKLYLSGLSDKQIAFIEQMQDKVEQFLKEYE